MDKVPGTFVNPSDDVPETLDELRLALDTEVRQWQANQMPPPPMWNHNIWDMDIRVMMLTQIMKERLGITDEELNVIFLQKQLIKMRQLRSEFLKSKIMEGVHNNNQPRADIKMPWEK